MKFFATSLLLFSSISSVALADKKGEMDVLRKQYSDSGLCMLYRGGDLKQSVQTCEKECGYKYEDGGMGCLGGDPSGDYRYKDENGMAWMPGKCQCDDDDSLKLASEITNIVLKGLESLDEVLCAVVYEAVKTTVDIGLTAIPGGFVTKKGFKVGIKAAKTIKKNGEAKSLFKKWYDGFCPSGEIGDDISKIWDEWTSVSDKLIPSGDCAKGNKKCKSSKRGEIEVRARSMSSRHAQSAEQ